MTKILYSVAEAFQFAPCDETGDQSWLGPGTAFQFAPCDEALSDGYGAVDSKASKFQFALCDGGAFGLLELKPSASLAKFQFALCDEVLSDTAKTCRTSTWLACFNSPYAMRSFRTLIQGLQPLPA